MLYVFCVGACSYRKTGIHPRLRKGMLFRNMRWRSCGFKAVCNGAMSGVLVRTDPLLFSIEVRAQGLEFLLLLSVDRRVGEVEFLHRFHNGRGDHEPSKPFVVCRHHVPRSMFRGGSPNRFLERAHVVAPELALGHVRGREFPMFVWLVEALHKALLLLFARQVQEELEDDRPLPS